MVATWQFVDRPEAAPAVLLNMTGGGIRVSREDFDVSPPPVRRSLVANAMSDGGVLTSASYDLRELRFTLILEGETEAARIAQLKAFEREVAKPANLLMYQPERHSTPVFFRTMRSDQFELDNQFVPGKAWKVKATVVAEPYAIGLRRDISPITVSNDPAAATNPARFDVPGPIVGDGPAPAFVRISNLGAGGTLLLAQRTINNPTALVNVAQAEAATLGTDAFLWTGEGLYSGTGANRAVGVTFGTNSNMTTRLTLTVPTATSSEALRGRYRVFLRAAVYSAHATSTFLIRFQQLGADTASGPTVSATIASGTFRLLDLGILEFPHATAAPSAIGYSGLPPGYATSQISIQAQRESGTGNLNMDYVYLMPVDERFCAVQQVASTGYLILDGPNDATYGMAAGTQPFGLNRTIDNGGGLVPRIGGLPMLVPGVLNRWYMLTGSGAIADSRTVEISYWPRWLDVATA
ncbi:MAG: hypothetical protein IRZ07_03425 [Microbispora sp.]|nr:hypothetical protein [Microbispora sp.]